MGHVISNKLQDAYFLADPKELLQVYLKFMDYVTIENIEVKNEAVLSDNAKIKELESIINEMKKKLDNVTEEI